MKKFLLVLSLFLAGAVLFNTQAQKLSSFNSTIEKKAGPKTIKVPYMNVISYLGYAAAGNEGPYPSPRLGFPSVYWQLLMQQGICNRREESAPIDAASSLSKLFCLRRQDTASMTKGSKEIRSR